jgi:hypothetical protein
MNIYSVTINDYAEAVATLVTLAQDSTGGSRIAAQVVLSAYNGDSFQLDVAGLCGMLDDKHFQAALTVFVGRKHLGKEPHQLLKDGDKIFSALCKQWERLHVNNRWKPRCSVCDGMRQVPVDPDDWDCEEYVTCKACNGQGW